MHGCAEAGLDAHALMIIVEAIGGMISDNTKGCHTQDHEAHQESRRCPLTCPAIAVAELSRLKRQTRGSCPAVAGLLEIGREPCTPLDWVSGREPALLSLFRAGTLRRDGRAMRASSRSHASLVGGEQSCRAPCVCWRDASLLIREGRIVAVVWCGAVHSSCRRSTVTRALPRPEDLERFGSQELCGPRQGKVP